MNRTAIVSNIVERQDAKKKLVGDFALEDTTRARTLRPSFLPQACSKFRVRTCQITVSLSDNNGAVVLFTVQDNFKILRS